MTPEGLHSRLLDQALPEIERLMPEAVQRGQGATFFVTCPDDEDPPDVAASLAGVAGSAPLVLLLNTGTVIRMLRQLGEDPRVTRIVTLIVAPRVGERAFVVFQYGDHVGCVPVRPAVLSPGGQA
jgi:hypothetical protein